MTELLVDIAGTDGNDKNGVSLVDWKVAAEHRVRGAIFRSNYERWSDATFMLNLQKAHDAAVRVGKYGFMVPGTSHPEPEAQIDVAYDAGPPLRAGYDLPFTIDIELPGGIAGTGMTLDALVKWYERAIAHAKARNNGKPCMAYSSPRVVDGSDIDAFRGRLNAALKGMWTWWARYIREARKAAVMPEDAIASGITDIAAKELDEGDIRQIQGDAWGIPGIPGIGDINVYYPITIGMHGKRVERVQARVGTPVDGGFGTLTLAAVKVYQSRRGIRPTGDVDLETFCQLANEAVAA
jgi:peptidoglycan hydrolase-like protein with peptidoglycan-binding domain